MIECDRLRLNITETIKFNCNFEFKFDFEFKSDFELEIDF